MKKLLSILAAVGLTATTGATVVACGPNNNEGTKEVEISLTQKEIKDISSPWGFIFTKKDGIQDKIAEAFNAEAKEYTNAEGIKVIGFKAKSEVKAKVKDGEGEKEVTQPEKTHLNIAAFLVRDKEKEEGWDNTTSDVKKATDEGGTFDVIVKLKTIDKDAKEWDETSTPPTTGEQTIYASATTFKLKVNVEANDIAKALKDKNLDLGLVKSSDEAAGKAKAVIDGVESLKGKVNLSTTVDGEVEVTPAKDSGLKGLATFTYELHEWKDISGIQIADVEAGTSMTEVEASIQTELDKVVEGAVLDTDYEIKGDTSVAQEKAITVSAMPDSKLIEGEFTIDVVLNDITPIGTLSVGVGTSLDALRGPIKDKINEVVTGTMEGTDYEIGGNADQVKEKGVTVTALSGSKLIKGSFAFDVVLNDITNVNVTPVEVGSSMDDLKLSIQTELDKIVENIGLDTDYIIEGDTSTAGDEAIKVSAIAGENPSDKITGSFTITVFEVKDIKDVAVPPVTVATSMEDVEAVIQVSLAHLVGVGGDIVIQKDVDYEVVGDTSVIGKITVNALTDSKYLAGSFTIIVYEVKNLSAFGMEAVKVGDDLDAIKSDVQTKLASWVGEDIQVQEDTDYNVLGNTTAVGEITVEAVATSKYLVGSFTIHVLVAINNIEVGPFEVDTDMAEVKNAVQAKLVELVGEGIEVKEEEDYIFKGDTTTAGEIIVEAVKTSKYLTGSFTITITEKN